jgi:hypothetical protein
VYIDANGSASVETINQSYEINNPERKRKIKVKN